MNGKHASCTGVGIQGTTSALSFLSNLEELHQLLAFSDKVRSLSLLFLLSLFMTLQPFRPWPLFRSLNPTHSQQDSLDGESAHHKATTYTQNNINIEKTHRDFHASSGVRTHDPSVQVGEDGSWFRPGAHCDRQVSLDTTESLRWCVRLQ
jgi:hypothetical protein